MSQDKVADALSMMKNLKHAKKNKVKIKIVSKLLLNVLKIMKEKGAIKSYKVDSKDKSMEVILGDFYDCNAIKPRFTINTSQIERYMRRYLPARGIGTIIISTNQGLMTHEEALEKQTGGCLIAYFY